MYGPDTTSSSATRRSFITVVSGLPRSGTSLMMQMLRAGGMEVMTDHLRGPDDDNPRGYFEFERVKQLKHDKSWLADANGKAVKIIHLLLMDLPLDRDYRVLFMNRDLGEVLRSQELMLQRLGKRGGALPPQRLREIYTAQLSNVKRWLAERPNFLVREFEYRDLVQTPQANATAIADFLGANLDVQAMANVVDPTLYRQR